MDKYQHLILMLFYSFWLVADLDLCALLMISPSSLCFYYCLCALSGSRPSPLKIIEFWPLIVCCIEHTFSTAMESSRILILFDLMLA